MTADFIVTRLALSHLYWLLLGKDQSNKTSPNEENKISVIEAFINDMFLLWI